MIGEDSFQEIEKKRKPSARDESLDLSLLVCRTSRMCNVGSNHYSIRILKYLYKLILIIIYIYIYI